MMINLTISKRILQLLNHWFEVIPWYFFVVTPAVTMAIVASVWSYANDAMVAYGDAESHLNIAKRVIHSLTPGAAQLGGIWLPLPHLMMVPFVFFDGLWRTGIAGAIVSGLCFIVTTIVLYKLTFLVTKNKLGSIAASAIFIFNPNIL